MCPAEPSRLSKRGKSLPRASRLAEIMIETMKNKDDEQKKGAFRAEVEAICTAFPVPEKFV